MKKSVLFVLCLLCVFCAVWSPVSADITITRDEHDDWGYYPFKDSSDTMTVGQTKSYGALDDKATDLEWKLTEGNSVELKEIYNDGYGSDVAVSVTGICPGESKISVSNITITITVVEKEEKEKAPSKDEEHKAPSNGVEAPKVVPLKEDATGAYQIDPETGEKEILLFQTYDICMQWMGDDAHCRDPHYCYGK